MSRRRRIIKTAGLLGTIGIAGTASANKENEMVPAAEVGLDEKVARLLRENETKEARKILEENNIEYSMSSSQTEDKSSDGGVSAQDYYGEGHSSVNTTLVRREDDRWLATGTAELNWGTNDWLKSPNVVNDGFSLDWDNSHWTSPNRTRENAWLVLNKTEEVAGDPPIEANIDEYTRYGIGGEVSYESVEPKYPDFVVSIQTDILRTDPHPEVGVAFQYKHTYAATGLNSSLSFAYGPGVVIEVPDTSDEWLLEDSVNP